MIMMIVMTTTTMMMMSLFHFHLIEGDRAYGYVRIETGDELSKRAKFAFITWIGESVGALQKAKVSTDKSSVKQIIQVQQRKSIGHCTF